ncbi:MAG: acyl carrier protein [Halobacteriovoraceae bacterium]|nr:acyl carrier protein [Halobacteriovoraceae bacterium]
MQTIEVKMAVLDIISDIIPDEDVSVAKDDIALREQFDLDSMDFLDIVMELKKRHRVDVPQEDFPKLSTLNGCVEYLTPKFA